VKYIWPGGSLPSGIRPEFKDKPAGGATQSLLAGNQCIASGPQGRRRPGADAKASAASVEMELEQGFVFSQ
jgi:hypothetical protein